MFNEKMRPVINRAMTRSLKNVNTYKGYDGADLVKFTFTDNDCLLYMRSYLIKDGYDQVVKMNDALELIVIFESSIDDSIYEIKEK